MVGGKGPLAECIPNFSEGRRLEVLEALADAIRSVPGVRLLHFSADPDHSRSVFTVVGSPQPLMEAIFRAARVAVQQIDMEQHHGQHPRLGAVDVIPFVPLDGVTMADCVHMAEGTAERIARELGVPAYLYGKAARQSGRVRLPDLRRGEYEELKANIVLPERRPDYGEPRLHPTAGATAVGARGPLIAFNINLGTTDLVIARKIAKAVRESSGGLVNVQARGLWMASRGLAQVSMNLLDYKRTPLYRAFEMVCLEAERYGVAVVSSEVIELLPLDAMVDTFVHYLRLEGFGREQVLEWCLANTEEH
jgi:glutamate formiminotransferase